MPQSLSDLFQGINLNNIGVGGTTMKGADGNMYTIAPHYTDTTHYGESGDTYGGPGTLDRYMVSRAGGTNADAYQGSDLYNPDGSYNMHAAYNGDNGAMMLAPIAAAAGGQFLFGGGLGGAAASGGADAVGGGAIASPVTGGSALGTSLGGASPGLATSAGAAGAGGISSITGNPILDKALSSAGTSALSSGLSSAISGKGTGSGLGGLVSGAYDAYAQNKASNNMLDYLKGQQAKIDSIYDPNGPLAKTMWNQMSAQDAAAGRNSQYGVRTTDFLGKFGGDYAKYTAQLGQGLANDFANAYNKQASAGTGLAAGIGNAMGGGALNSIVQNGSSYINNAYNSAAGNGMANWQNNIGTGSVNGDQIYG